VDGDQINDLAAMARGIEEKIGGDANGLMALEAADFDLGAFAPVIEAVKHNVTEGPGLSLIRGLPVEKWGKLRSATVYWGLGRHLGRAKPNNPEGEMFGHIADMGKDYDNPDHRGYQTSAEMYFHSDQNDLLTLLAMQKGKSGGITKVVSSVNVHNVMLERRPDLVEILAQPLTYSCHGEEGPHQGPWFESPAITYVDGGISVSGGFKHIEKGHKLPGRAPLTEKQLEAYAFFENICEEFHFGTVFEPGDMPILNSHVTLHARTAFEDWPEVERRRHFWRMWLHLEGPRPRAPFFEHWKDGIWVEEGGRKITLGA
ncbi:MAG: TauD/TfdA family dioxygenase, partial [Rhodospirillales bacterium]|nr:TauD/TfdA family dioxygenase [Rhodospirillales bacterium]